MSHLADLLGASEPSFTNKLKRLEVASGHPDVDVRLTSDIAKKVHFKLKELGLDPSDTSGKELFYGLQALVAKHDEFLVKAVGASSSQKVDDLLPRLVDKARKLTGSNKSWALKHSAAKRLIKAMPPKKLMKYLGYRSVDSLLKREDIVEIYAGLRLIESSTWQKRFINSYKKLNPMDFETRKIEIVNLSSKRWLEPATQYVSLSGKNIFSCAELGVVIVTPLPIKHFPGICITVLPRLLSYVNEVRLLSAYFKLQQVKPNFGHLLVGMLGSNSKYFFIADSPITWRSIYRYWGKPNKKLPDTFETYIQLTDLGWQAAEDLLYKLEPALKFWEDLDWVAAWHDNKPVPLGLADNATSYCNGLEYGIHSVSYFKESLWDEIYSRYLEQKPLEEDLIKQLDNSSDFNNFMMADVESLA